MSGSGLIRSGSRVTEKERDGRKARAQPQFVNGAICKTGDWMFQARDLHGDGCATLRL
jgi:hypothetical protein